MGELLQLGGVKTMSDEGYLSAGVDRSAAARAKTSISKHARTTFTPQVVGDIGFFGSLYRLEGFRDPVLVSHTDGVGTKLRVAALLGRYHTVGEDIVHHCVNDILTCGAKPLFFLDYIGMGKLIPEKAEELVEGMARACRAIDCALIGGETAELPGLYQAEDFDLVGFIVGAAERSQLIDGSRIKIGDVLMGIPSSGLHTNGYSLVRRVFGVDDNPSVLEERPPELEGRVLGDELLIPHRCYYLELAPVLDRIRGMAHITGGGLLENMPRILPPGVAARFRIGSWEVPPIFRLVQGRGGLPEKEMFGVFNMGLGMVLAVGEHDVAVVQAAVQDARVIGEVVLQEREEQILLE